MYQILEVAIPCPLRQRFEYWVFKQTPAWLPGIRVTVPFGSRSVIGLVCAVRDSIEQPEHLKTIENRLDDTPLLPDELQQLIQWLSQYYHHPIGECVQTALPKQLRQGQPAVLQTEPYWTFCKPAENRLGSKQIQILEKLQTASGPVREQDLKQQFGTIKNSLVKLQQAGLIQTVNQTKLPVNRNTEPHRWPLNTEQQLAYQHVLNNSRHFQPFLLRGITGSGKTELYIQLAQHWIEQGRQVLVLIPEIHLSSQFVSRFQKGLTARIGLSHSGISDTQRMQTWLLARDAEIDVVIGTRSAVFTPFKNLGLIIIDEEHDSAYKQQDGLRYHARNIALLRARNLQLPIVLGSATPSLESLYQVQQQRFQLLTLTQRTGQAQLPDVELVDCTALKNSDNGLSRRLINAISTHLAAGQQVLVFINRRGFAPILMCHECGWQADCRHCDSKMVVHQQSNQLVCHHCGYIQRLPDQCPECQATPLHFYGLGTEKIEQTLNQLFPETPVLRIDRDTTQRHQAFPELLTVIEQQQPAILVGTQMLAKGHDFPAVTLVGILDADQGLFSADFRAMELLAQSIIQVTGRAGRGDKPGTVLIQTRQPAHPFWQQLLSEGYDVVAHHLLQERLDLALPPKQFWAVWRAEAKTAGLAISLLEQLLATLPPHQDVLWMGPVPAIMEKRAGRYRAQILFSSAQRKALHQVIYRALENIQTLKLARKVRWSVDIDPTELL